ncbi:loganic acid O-methyltransferase-like [Nicotiana tabacum]|uniref:Loganic acid O-methyltransferase-like n=1 Tax=Nicotiana tabacum TaxID=4097 RepID=A0A1S4BYW7_TOBAC|nr:PREDICTED: probable S-adenosylmethionine-dependent methyltransferase At5g38100 [Nicotiana tabacum]
MADSKASSLLKPLPMKGGDGTYSYSKNSTYQREGLMVTKEAVNEAISKLLDISNTSSTIRIADLGCSIGPNTYIAVQNLIEAVQKKYALKGFSTTEFQVFFNDVATNDFNTLFASLPPENHYFAAGVPGSFYSRLFPESSIDIVHASYALCWLSQVPIEVENKEWNRGKIFYSTSSDEVAEAYAAQFAKDVNNFLNARAKEIVVGGLLILVTPAIPQGFHRSKSAIGFAFDAIGSALMDMANDGIISEAQVDSFNLPYYITTPNEMVKLVERNDCFSIEIMKTPDPFVSKNQPINAKENSDHLRAAFECLIADHFGSSVVDQLFERIDQNEGLYSKLDASYSKVLLLLALKRKPSKGQN